MLSCFIVKALTEFLSWKLTDDKVCTKEWNDVVLGLDETKKIQQFIRMAKNKFDENDDRALCRSIFTDWMKEKPHQEDKVLHGKDIIIIQHYCVKILQDELLA